MTAPKAGYKGAVWYGTDYKIASATWTYSGETRNMQDMDEFQDEYIKQVPLQIVGGDITITGNYLIAEDSGQKQLKIDFDAATEITNLRLYTDKTNTIYMTPKAGSHLIVTNVNNAGDDKSGIGTFSATLHVNGELEQVGSTTVTAVETVGVIDIAHGGAGAGNAEATLWGKLTHRGGDANDIECYFEWGLTTSYGSDSYASETTFATPDKGEYDHSITDLTEDSTYHYRAVALKSDTSKVYGDDMTFDVPADV